MLSLGGEHCLFLSVSFAHEHVHWNRKSVVVVNKNNSYWNLPHAEWARLCPLLWTSWYLGDETFPLNWINDQQWIILIMRPNHSMWIWNKRWNSRYTLEWLGNHCGSVGGILLMLCCWCKHWWNKNNNGSPELWKNWNFHLYYAVVLEQTPSIRLPNFQSHTDEWMEVNYD